MLSIFALLPSLGLLLIWTSGHLFGWGTQRLPNRSLDHVRVAQTRIRPPLASDRRQTSQSTGSSDDGDRWPTDSSCLWVDDGPWGLPLTHGWITSRYTGYRMHPLLHRPLSHYGIDIAAPQGTPILAAGDGRVAAVAPTPTYGTAIDIVHSPGVITRYAHAATALVRVGMPVHRGQVIALVGATGRTTGPHLHYEIFIHWRSVDPLAVWQHVRTQRCRGPASTPSRQDKPMHDGGNAGVTHTRANTPREP